MTAPLVIIGSGLAGYLLAKEWRKLDTTRPLEIFTKDDGSFYSKPQLSTALTQKKTPTDLVISTADAMSKQLNATIHPYTEINRIDPQKKLVFYEKKGEEKHCEYSDLILALGAKKVKPHLKGNAVNEVQSVNNLEDYRYFYDWLADKRHIIIMGAGLVGCEFANDLITSGYQVDVIDAKHYPLSRLVPEPIGSGLAKAMQNKGLNWHFNHLVTDVNQKENNFQVTLSDNTHLEADGVFCAIGIRPNIELAKQSGLKTDCGIMVDRYLKTSADHVYALGDCAEVKGKVYQHIAPLLQCARALAKIIAGGNDPVHYPAMPIVVKTPICPVVTSPPPLQLSGEWILEGEGENLKAFFRDEKGLLRGFSLLGQHVRDKIALEKQLPAIFEN